LATLGKEDHDFPVFGDGMAVGDQQARFDQHGARERIERGDPEYPGSGGANGVRRAAGGFALSRQARRQ